MTKNDKAIAEAYCNRGITYYGKGKFNQTIKDYIKAKEINPKLVVR